MHINEDVLAEVMELTGASSKTQAVEIALNEMARRHKLKKILAAGAGVSGDELAAAFADHSADSAESAGQGGDPAVVRFVAVTDARRARQAALHDTEPHAPERPSPYGQSGAGR